MAPKFGLARQISNLPDKLLSRVVPWMCFAGENQLDRASAVREDTLKARQVAQNQGRAFVCGKTPRENDGQSAGIEHFLSDFDFMLGCAAAHPLPTYPVPCPGDQTLTTAFVGPPELISRDRIYATPDFAAGGLFAPMRPEVTIIELIQLQRNPTTKVHAVGDVLNRDLVYRHRRP